MVRIFSGCSKTRVSRIAAVLLALSIMGGAPGVSAQSQPAAPLVQALPVEAYARLPFIEQAHISPDGTRVVGLTAINGVQEIVIINLFDKNEQMKSFRLSEGNQVRSLQWVNDDNVIAGISALLSVAAGDRWYVSRAVGINRKTGELKRLLWDQQGQGGADLLWIANDGSPDVIIAAQNSIFLDEEFWPKVWRVNVETGSRRRVLNGRINVMDWAVDGQGNVRTGLSYRDETRTFSLLYRDPGETGFRIIDRANARLQEDLFSPVLFIPDTDRALTLHNDDQGIAGIYETDLTTREDVRLIYAAPVHADIESLTVSHDGSTLLGVRTSSAGSGAHWFDPQLAGLQAEFDRSVGPSKSARIISLSRDRKRMLVMVGQINSPGTLYFFDVDDGRLLLFSAINDAVTSRSLAPVRMISYPARDGTEIEAVLTLPPGREAKRLPVIMMPHGGPWAHDSLSYDYWAQFVASRGYAVIQPNFRGSDGYGEAFLRKGEGQMGLAMQDDITDGLRWAVAQGIADPARACIVGASYGGYAAMWGIAKDPDLYRCAISVSGVSSIRAEVNDFGSFIMGGKFKDDWRRMTPDFAAVSPINAVDRIKAPLLLIHGRRDVTVDSDQSGRMYSRMRAAGKTVEYVELPLADHYFTRQEDRLRLLTEIERFLIAHNPPGPPPGQP